MGNALILITGNDKSQIRIMIRRKNKSLRDSFRQAIWPRMGWLRLFRYYGLRLYRLNDPPYAVAAGLASGVAISFTPFIGFHLILAILLARLLNGSLIAAMIGTLAGNPWTIPLILYMTYKVGMLVLGNHAPAGIPHGFDVETIFSQPWRYLLPMTIGSIPFALSFWLATFFPLVRLIRGLQRQRIKRRAKARLRNMRLLRKRLKELNEIDRQQQKDDTA